MKRKRKMVLIIASVVILILILVIFVVFPPSLGKAKPFRDENGNVIPNSIAEKCHVEVDGCELGMYILGKDISNPVLLVCGGGPGIPQYFLEHERPSCLTDQFVVCYWDYRGTGLSYDSSIHPDDVTTQKYISDIKEVTDYLCERFDKEKIYIMGHSFGTYMALNTISRYPERYHAYFAMSQVCNQIESEYLAYDYMKEQYEKNGNTSMVKKFEKCSIRESDEYYNKYFESSLRDTAMHELGIGTTRDMKSVITGIFFPSLRIKEYTQGERINFWRGKIASGKFAVTHDSSCFNAFEEIVSVKVPVYFFAGEYDYTCAYSLQKEYFKNWKLLKKSFIRLRTLLTVRFMRKRKRRQRFLRKYFQSMKNKFCMQFLISCKQQMTIVL